MTLTNTERANRGVRRLSVASDLTSIAERHSRNMASRRSIYHDENLPNEVSGWRKLGENVGRGSSARSVHNAFMSSSTHRSHILDPSYNQIGVGAVRGSDNYLYITEVFAGRGAVHVTRTTRRATVHRHSAPRRPVHHAKVVRAAPALDPCRSVGMLLSLLALDAPSVAQKYIPEERSPP